MENLQLKTHNLPPAAGKAAPANDVSTEGAVTAAPTGFQALLQQLMGSEDIAVATAMDTPRRPVAATEAAEESERDCTALTTAGVAPAEPPPLIVLPAMPPPAIAAGNTPTPPPAPVGTAKIPSSKLAGANEPGSLPSAQPHAPEAAAALETAVTGKTPPRFLQNIGEAHLARTTQTSPEHAHQSHSESHNATITELPRFAEGLQLAEPARSLATAPVRVNTPVGAPEWNSEFAQKIVWMAGEKQHSAELHLNPPDLGPVNIKLSVDENQIRAIFTSPHGEVRQAIEDALPRLREVLADSGITLGNASVTSDSPRDGSAFDRQRQSLPSFAGTTGAGGSGTMTEAEPGRVIPRGRGNGLVDVFA